MKKDIKIGSIKICVLIFIILFSFSLFNITNIGDGNCVSAESAALTENEILNLSSYDSRDYGLVTSVKDQGSSSLCWAYSAIAASETSVLKSGVDKTATKDTLSLSPTSIGYGRYNRPADPLNNVVGEASGNNWLNSAGESAYAGILMSQWWGPISASLPASTNAYENNLYKLKNMVQIYDDATFYNFDTRIAEMKKAIAKYGAITFSYNNLRETQYYNPKREKGSNYSFHACTIIGWDDNISASYFVPSGTKKNGGWLVKNSYSSLPYFWLSYECVSSNIYAFDFSRKGEYDYNYFYDDSLNGGFTQDLKTQYVANIYEAKKATSDKDEYLKAVNVAFACKNATVTVDVYTELTDSSNPESGILKATKTQAFDHPGYRTVDLDDLVKLEKGEKFSVVVRLSNSASSSPYVSTSQGNGSCYRKINGNWYKINNNALRIKGYTVLAEKQSAAPVTVDIKNAAVAHIPDLTYNGNALRPSVTLSYDGKTLTENSDYTLSYSNNVNASSQAKITITGTGKFNGVREIFFTIVQAEKPNVAIPETIGNPQNHKVLKQISLPSGFVWQEPDLELANGANSVTIVYNEPDKANYKNVTFSVQVTYTEEITPDVPTDKPVIPPDKPDVPSDKPDIPNDKPNAPNDQPTEPSPPNNEPSDGGSNGGEFDNNHADSDNMNGKLDTDGSDNGESLSNSSARLRLALGIGGGCLGVSVGAGVCFFVRKIKKTRGK